MQQHIQETQCNQKCLTVPTDDDFEGDDAVGFARPASRADLDGLDGMFKPQISSSTKPAKTLGVFNCNVSIALKGGWISRVYRRCCDNYTVRHLLLYITLVILLVVRMMQLS